MMPILRQASQYPHMVRVADCPPGQVCAEGVGGLSGPGSKSIDAVSFQRGPTTDMDFGDMSNNQYAQSVSGGGGGVGSSAGGGPSAGGSSSRGDSGGNLKPETQGTLDWINQNHSEFSDIGGYRPPDGYNEHSSGSALDVMLPEGYDTSKAPEFMNGVFENNPNANYILYNQTQYNRDGSSSAMEDRGSATQNHQDHFHINNG